MPVVTFDGLNRLIKVDSPTTEIDVQIEIYSDWKEWVVLSDNAKWPKAVTAIGGDPITATTKVGITYFLENGWRIEPYVGNYLLDIDGNLFTREEGGNPIVSVSGVTTSLTRSNLVDILVSGSGVTAQDMIDIAKEVWDEDLDGTGQIAREKLDKVATKTQDIALA